MSEGNVEIVRRSARVTVRIAWIYTVRDGLIARIDAFADRADALEAAGLRE